MEEALARVLEANERIAYGVVFGSTGRGTAHAGSDVDIAVGLSAGATLSPLDRAGLLVQLEEAAGKPADLVVVGEAPCSLSFRIFRDGRTIFVRSRPQLVSDRALAIADYLDFKPIEDRCTAGVLAAARGR